MLLPNRMPSGEPILLGHHTYNAFVDTARAYAMDRHNQGRPAEPNFRQAGIVRVRNESGQSRSRCDVLGLDGPVIKPTENGYDFQNLLAFKGVVPAAAHKGRFAVLLDALPPGGLGRAVAAGVAICRLDVTFEGDVFADALAGDATKLRGGIGRGAKLLWVQPAAERSGGFAWAVVHLGLEAEDEFWAKITGWAALAANRWKYAWTEVVLSGDVFTNRTNGRSGTTSSNYALNIIEANNTGAGVRGNSVDQSGPSYPAGYSLKPVGAGVGGVVANPVIVRMRELRQYNASSGLLELRYAFPYENADDGTC